jgi:hypothetical protein
MATTLQSIITDVRSLLIAPISGDNADEFWTDAELLGHCNRGIKELWREINDLYQNYFLTVDKTNVYTVASSDLLAGVPSDVSIIRKIAPRDPTAYPYLRFEYKSYDHRDFIAAETQAAVDQTQIRLIYFYISQAGAPVAAPEIHIAPLVSAAIPLTLAYVPTLATLTASDNNPIPGESDQALISWTLAWARAKEREDRSPDPNIIATYAAERQKILTALTPRQTQDEEVAEALFEEWS